MVNMSIRDAITRLTAEARDSASAAVREAATVTGALPVHIEMGGALALTADGDIVQYDFETGTTNVPEEVWRIAALVKAARRFPELRDLVPPRPIGAVDCPACGGRGLILGDMDCGTCIATGWIAQS